MAYSVANPPRCAVPSVGGASPAVWTYQSDDAATAVRAANYITDAEDLGMKVGDIVIQSGTGVAHLYQVIAVTNT
jgi:hypothetical protein